MNHRPSTLALLALSLLRCVQRGADADAAGDMSGVPPDDAEGRIHCTYAYRQTNVASDAPSPAALQFEERTLELGAGDVAGATLGQLTLTARYSSDELEGSSFSLSVAADDAQLFSVLYQFDGALPQNQFAGGHGFTGLSYFTHPTAGGDYQSFCDVRR